MIKTKSVQTVVVPTAPTVVETAAVGATSGQQFATATAEPTAGSQPAAAATAAMTSPSTEHSLTAVVVALWLGFRQRLHAQLQLLSLETQRAAQSLVNMLILALFAALLLISCWFGLLSIGMLLLKSAGLSTIAALTCLVLINGIALVSCLKFIRAQSCYLCFPATMALLKPVAASSSAATPATEQKSDA